MEGGAGPAEWPVAAGATSGEAEIGTFRNVKHPALLYHYLCALKPGQPGARVQIQSRTLRTREEAWGEDRLESFLGSVISRTSSSELLVEEGRVTVRPIGSAGLPAERAPLLRKIGEPIVEVGNDHFPTAVFLRRIVEVEDAAGERTLALEEDMSMLRLAAIGCERTVTVASIHDDDKFAALDRVLAATGFDDLLEARRAASGKPPEGFRVVIKPNFMFA